MHIEDTTQRLGNPTIGILNREALRPILEVGKVAFGQLELRIKGHIRNLLPFACAIHHALHLKATKDRLIHPRMRPLETADFLTIWQHDGFSHITWPDQAKQQPQSLMAKVQDPMPNTGFHLMHRDALAGCPFHIGLEVIQGGLQLVRVAIGTGLRHAFHHVAPLRLGAS